MRRSKQILSTLTLAAVIGFGGTFANAGIIVNGVQGDNPCVESSADGIIVNGLVGIIVNGFTGIIVNGFAGSNDTCGIIVNG